MCDGRGFVFYIIPLQNLDVLKSLNKTIGIVCCNVMYQCINIQCIFTSILQIAKITTCQVFLVLCGIK
jgi:hypothetical protein